MTFESKKFPFLKNVETKKEEIIEVIKVLIDNLVYCRNAYAHLGIDGHYFSK